MKVYVYPADTFGCGYFRLIWPARALIAQGHDVTVVMPGTAGMAQRNAVGAIERMPSPLQLHTDPYGRATSVNAPRDADVMVLQRITHRGLASAIPLWRKNGIAVVVDIDDDLSAIHPSNPAWRALHPHHGKPGFSWEIAHQACRDATLVTTSTPELARRYAPHGRSAVLYNCVPESYLKIDHADSDVVGWGGTVASHPDDLQAMGPALQRHTAVGGRFTVVGPPNGVTGATGMADGTWEATGSIGLPEWPAALSANIGIGIAPLADTRFNQGKSWLKPLEYSALGIPVVMSPRAEYSRLHQLGVGVLAGRPKDWSKGVRDLVSSPAMRQELGHRGRQVAAELTIEGRAWWWAQAWAEAHRLQHS